MEKSMLFKSDIARSTTHVADNGLRYIFVYEIAERNKLVVRELLCRDVFRNEGDICRGDMVMYKA